MRAALIAYCVVACITFGHAHATASDDMVQIGGNVVRKDQGAKVAEAVMAAAAWPLYVSQELWRLALK